MRRRVRLVVAGVRRFPWAAVAFDGMFVAGTLLVAAGIRAIYAPAALMFVGLTLLGLWTVRHLR